MWTWGFGVLLLVCGVGWLVLRATIERKASMGSWWSHLGKQVGVIRDVPVVGVVWRVAPILLIAAGVAWLLGLRPPGFTPAPAERLPTLCGDVAARPTSIPEVEWTRYTCTGRAAAEARWPLCLDRAQYTIDAGRGCPGKARCCPAE